MARKDADKDQDSAKPTVGSRVAAFLNPFKAAQWPTATARQTARNHKPNRGHNDRPAPSSHSGPSKVKEKQKRKTKAGAGAQVPAPQTRLRLLDLDQTRNELGVKVAVNTVVSRLEDVLRSRSSKKQPLANDDVLQFFCLRKPAGDGIAGPGPNSGPQQLQPSDIVSGICPLDATIYYRISHAGAASNTGHDPGQHLKLRVEWLSPSSAPYESHGHHGSRQDCERKGGGGGSGGSSGGRQRKMPDPDFLRELTRDIFDPDQKLAVGAIRSRLAAVLGVSDPNRIALFAYGGLQPCQPLAGVAWHVGRLLTAWLCRCLMVQVHPPKRYVVVQGGGGVLRDGDGAERGLRRTYLYHELGLGLGLGLGMKPGQKLGSEERSSSRSGEVSLTSMRKWVRDRLLRGVHEHVSSQLHCRLRHIELVDNGGGVREVLKQRSRVPWGSTVEFRLRDDVIEAFADDETWLLPTTETCMICLEEKAVTEMPHRITAACLRHADQAQRHTPTLCKPCLAEWISSSLQSSVWNRLRCPECPARLSFADVRLYAARPVFERYDTLATRAALVSEFPNFRWCLAVGCESGQIHGPPASRATGARPVEEDCPKFRCHTCRATHCIRHNTTWHSGETCSQYDLRTQRRRQDNRKSEAFVQKTSKPCPGCSKAVFKYSGCNHISCICGHQWCYVCFAPFVQSDFGILRCQHKPECSEQDLFDELGLNVDRRRGLRPAPLIWRAGQRRARAQ